MRNTLYHSYRMACICSLIEKGVNKANTIFEELRKHNHGYSYQQIYNDLQKLESDSCITKKHRVYKLTINGEYHLKAWKMQAYLP